MQWSDLPALEMGVTLADLEDFKPHSYWIGLYKGSYLKCEVVSRRVGLPQPLLHLYKPRYQWSHKEAIYDTFQTCSKLTWQSTCLFSCYNEFQSDSISTEAGEDVRSLIQYDLAFRHCSTLKRTVNSVCKKHRNCQHIGPQETWIESIQGPELPFLWLTRQLRPQQH